MRDVPGVQRFGGQEAAVGAEILRPWRAPRSRDVTGPRVDGLDLAPVALSRTRIEQQRIGAEQGGHLLGADEVVARSARRPGGRGVRGDLAGQRQAGIGPRVDPTVEDAYWRDNYSKRPYADPTYTYDDDYRPAYEYGWKSRSQHADRSFDEAESDLSRGWDRAKGKSRLSWDKAKMATRDSWHRVERAIPGDFDRDGR